MKEIIETLAYGIFISLAVFSLYIGMVLEPECEKKGFAGVSRSGCYIIIDGIREYEINQ